MTVVPEMKKRLCDASQSAHHILTKICPVSHIFYYSDHDNPIIAFLPTEYFKFEQKHISHYVQTKLNQYEFKAHLYSIDALNKHYQNFVQRQDSAILGGFFSYDLTASLQVSSGTRPQDSAFIGIFSNYLQRFDDGWWFISNAENADEIYDFISLKFHEKNKPLSAFRLNNICLPRWNKSEYAQAFHQVQEYIKAGDCYQINLTQEFCTTAKGQLLDTADQFWNLTEAPYAGYLKTDAFELLSCSPELFIDFKADRKISTKPIKGTMPRYENPAQDELSRQRLIHSEKDQAENVMIVDLLRNDLSVYAETGSVKTPRLFNIESFNQVHHMVSEVTARLKKEANPLDVLISALPGGSITGAPKIRAMQIIQELEGAPRGAYCGSMGYFRTDGTGSWNILIRSIQKYMDDVSLWAGGGITISSDCDAEYQECFDKVSAMLDLLNTWYQPDCPDKKSES